MNEATTTDFGRLLREHRLASNLTQEGLAERAGMGVRSIQALERGESKPLQDTLRRLTAVLDLTPEERVLVTAAAGPTPRRRTAAAPEIAPFSADRGTPHDAAPAPVYQFADLPLPLSSFVGREQELTNLTQLVQQVRLLTLTGPGGTGKTRLALRVAETVREHFTGGVVFVPLAAILDPSLVAITIASGLGVQQGEEPSLSHALIICLRPRRLLLVLDNFEQVVTTAPLVAELLAGCPTLTIMVTSRMPLHLSGEQEYAVPPLAVPANNEEDLSNPDRVAESPAVALFVQRARLVHPEFALTVENAAVVGEICRRLDGLPLAIELAAARIKLLTPTDLLTRLGRRLEVLHGGPRNLPAHQQTLRGTMDWSYDLLSPAEQNLFRRLAVFAGGWTLAAAESVCRGDDGGDPVLDTLGSLIDKSLLTVERGTSGDTRYGMLETIQAYALERLEDGGETEEPRRRHAAYYRHLAEHAAPEPGSKVNSGWLAWTEREQDNLRAAVRWAHERGEVELETRLMLPLISFWYAHRHMREAQNQLEMLLGLQDGYSGQLPAELLIHALSALAGTLWHYGEYIKAEALIEECLEHCRAEGAMPYVRLSLLLHGHITCEKGDYACAYDLFREARELAREAGDHLSEVRALLGLGDVARGLGDGARVTAICEESLILNREVGDKEIEGYTLHNLGVAAWLQGDSARADELLERSLTIFRERGTHITVAEMLTSLGRLRRTQGRLEQAQSMFVESLMLAQTAGPFFVMLDDLDELAGLATAENQAESAARLFGLTQAVRQARGMVPTALRGVFHDRDMAKTRASLGEGTFEAAYRSGHAMRLEDAIAVALEVNGNLRISRDASP
jgi:predicted ATPase/transcriptional regulator with XRE-family HTH domain